MILDTHVFLWVQTAPGRLAASVRSLLDDPASHFVLSAASAWEIAIKYAIGRLPLPDDPATYVPNRMARSGIGALAVEHEHVLRVAALHHHHGDPFDRVLIAQAQVEQMPIVTSDPVFGHYEVEVIPAA